MPHHTRSGGQRRAAQPGAGSGTTLLYIGGLGRSGSTLLERLLGQIDGVSTVGELKSLWQHRLEPGRLCGCGQPLSRCSLWSSLDAVSSSAAEAALRLQRHVDRTRYLPLLLAPWLRPAFARRLELYRALLKDVYDDVASRTGATVIVDSSKSPSNAVLLHRLRGVDLRVVHLVRDSRGVAHSWRKRMPMEPRRDSPPMARESAPRVALLWSSYNVLFAGLRFLGVPVLRLHYEDLVADPQAELARLVAFAGLPPGTPLGFVHGASALLERTAHTVAGNPMRFEHGQVDIRADEQWRTALPSAQRRLVTVLTAPGLVRYGYLPRRPLAAAAPAARAASPSPAAGSRGNAAGRPTSADRTRTGRRRGTG